ncbi:MAG TPA: aspartate aminotransferase family protein [Kouleothrix sp.]|uniref:aminotransferase family protein n=1 Tax=Kouleothrix sp. TaxID=2779161 RepID=UPI002C5CA413|nr:aspartate aminotransferase family protein [Kouleothrix sp.]HRC76969.1 aspartate aminotransferase family protein [Kouleothrix sp.]
MTTTIDERTRADQAHLIHPLHHPSAHQAPKIWVSGEGALVRDAAGNEYIDGLSGLWNVHIGHGRRELAQAAFDQMSTLAYNSSYAGSTNLPAIALAEKLSALTYPSINTFFFTSGGAEASESSFKTARFYWKALGKPDKTKIIARTRAYHGVTLAAMSATGLANFWPMFEPRVPGFLHIDSPYPYRFVNKTPGVSDGVAAANLLEEAILREGADTVAAFIAEPVQGAGGVIVPQDDYFARVREICSKYDVLLIADEVITGFGRTGRWFGLERYGIEPDIIQFAKGVTSGYVPLGGIGVSDTIRDVMNGVPPEKRWMHAFTYSGHPTCAAVALKNIEIIENEGLVGQADEVGQYFQSRLQGLAGHAHVGDVRGVGMIAAVEVVADKASKQQFPATAGVTQKLVDAMLERGLFTRVVLDAVCLAPPLVTSEAQIDQIVEAVGGAIDSVTRAVQG